MAHTKEKPLLIGIFMPFEPKYSFIYEEIKRIEKDLGEIYSVQIKRADDIYSANRSKPDDIKKLIEDCHIAIFDISQSKENVLYEYGYADCLNKPKITIIGEDFKDKIPFNLLSNEIIKYTFSVSGAQKLTSEIKKCILEIMNDTKYLIDDPVIQGHLKIIRQGVKEISSESLLNSLVKGEFDRLTKRINSLRNEGMFDLRSYKPEDEVIKYYSDYVSQLNNEKCSFLTVTNMHFWKFISNNGRDTTFFEANKRAIEKGTTIKRIFRIPNQIQIAHADNRIDFKDISIQELCSGEKFLQEILKKHYEASQEFGEKFQTKIIFYKEKDHFSDLNGLGNYAIWRKGEQLLIFKPIYGPYGNTDKENRLIETRFYYHKEPLTEDVTMQEEGFNTLWKESIELKFEHFNSN
ncbi:MAG: hypothetical protein U0Y10_10565 [Spirosomataceae bacterium]